MTEFVPEREMTPDEQEWATALYGSIMDFDRERPRSKQTADFVVGMSELGFCSERTRRMLAGIAPVGDVDKFPAFIGTAIGDYIEQAIQLRWGKRVIRQAEVVTRLEGEIGQVYNLTGHPDLIFPDDGILMDVKTDRGLSIVKRTGPSDQQQYQRHGYAKGAWEAGLFPDHDLEDIRVANVWFDRAADDREAHVQMEPYDPAVIASAGRWLDDVVYAYINQQEARKEPPRQMCEVICGHFKDCRAFDTDVEGLLTEDRVLTAVSMYQEGLSLEAEGRKLKDQSKAALKGIVGSTGEFSVRWVHVNESEIKPGFRKPYDRLQISKIK